VDAGLLALLLAQGRTPVLASIAATAAGELLNLNADDVAAALAIALRADDLVLLSDTPGLLLDGEVVPQLHVRDLEATLARPDVGGGMVPKLRSAGAALAGGVARAHIAAWDGPGTLAALLASGGPGTTLVAPARIAPREDAHA
jgi:acetylglutamate kinase